MYLIVQILVQCCIWQFIFSHPIGDTVYRKDETFFMTERMRQLYSGLIVADRDRLLDQETEISEDTNPESIFNVTSSCPWKLMKINNNNRIPSTHIEAKCLTLMCLNLTANVESSEGHHNGGTFRRDATCREIKYARWVHVKSETLAGTVKWNKRLLLVNVGCTCRQERHVLFNSALIGQ